MSNNLILKELSPEGSEALRQLVELKKQGQELIVQMADVVGKMQLEDIEIISKHDRTWEKIFVDLLGISNQTLHIGLYGAEYHAAKRVRKLPLRKQEEIVKDGISVPRKADDGKWVLTPLQLHQLNSTDIEIAFDGEKLRSLKQMKYQTKLIDERESSKPKVDIEIVKIDNKAVATYDKVSDMIKFTGRLSTEGGSKEEVLTALKRIGWIS